MTFCMSACSFSIHFTIFKRRSAKLDRIVEYHLGLVIVCIFGIGFRAETVTQKQIVLLLQNIWKNSSKNMKHYNKTLVIRENNITNYYKLILFIGIDDAINQNDTISRFIH